MQPIHELLNEIKWNPNLDKKAFTVCYYDRVLDKLLTVNFLNIKHFNKTFIIIEKEGKEIEIPLHRIKEVRKHGTLIWKRKF